MESKSCSNCHFCDKPLEEDPCQGCRDFGEPSAWQPMTNGDKVRKMTDEDLRELWSVQRFDEKYIPECRDKEDSCAHWNFFCECCPETFYNWLKAEAD